MAHRRRRRPDPVMKLPRTTCTVCLFRPPLHPVGFSPRCEISLPAHSTIASQSSSGVISYIDAATDAGSHLRQVSLVRIHVTNDLPSPRLAVCYSKLALPSSSLAWTTRTRSRLTFTFLPPLPFDRQQAQKVERVPSWPTASHRRSDSANERKLQQNPL